MENCLVTKLKGVVNNDNLRKVGELRFTIDAVDSQTENNRTFSIGGTDILKEFYDSNGNAVTWPYLGSGIAKVTKFYDITNIDTGRNNTTISCDGKDFAEMLKYNSVLSGFNCKMDIDLSVFKSAACKNTLTALYLEQGSITGDISNLADIISAQYIFLVNPYIIGNVSSLGGNINLKVLELNATNVEGSYEEFAAAQVAAGRTSGTCRLQGNGRVTLNGTAVGIRVSHTITFNSSLPNGYSIE